MFSEWEVEEVLGAYIEAALWSTADDDGEHLDTNYTAEENAPDSLAQMRRDVERFLGLDGDETTAAMMFEDVREFALAARVYLPSVGHDFWLTRNRHGVGFWDRGAGDIGEYLTERAQRFAEVNLYVGDDGLIYTS